MNNESEWNRFPDFLFFDHVAVSVRPGELEAQVEAYRRWASARCIAKTCWAATRCARCCCRWATVPTWCSCWSRSTPESPVAKQIEKNGGRGGLAHVALRVADIRKAFDYMRENGFKIIDKAPRKGSRGTTVFFVHPKTTEAAAFGYLIEVVEEGSHA